MRSQQAELICEPAQMTWCSIVAISEENVQQQMVNTAWTSSSSPADPWAPFRRLVTAKMHCKDAVRSGRQLLA